MAWITGNIKAILYSLNCSKKHPPKKDSLQKYITVSYREAMSSTALEWSTDLDFSFSGKI